MERKRIVQVPKSSKVVLRHGRRHVVITVAKSPAHIHGKHTHRGSTFYTLKPLKYQNDIEENECIPVKKPVFHD